MIWNCVTTVSHRNAKTFYFFSCGSKNFSKKNFCVRKQQRERKFFRQLWSIKELKLLSWPSLCGREKYCSVKSISYFLPTHYRRPLNIEDDDERERFKMKMKSRTKKKKRWKNSFLSAFLSFVDSLSLS